MTGSGWFLVKDSEAGMKSWAENPEVNIVWFGKDLLKKKKKKKERKKKT